MDDDLYRDCAPTDGTGRGWYSAGDRPTVWAFGVLVGDVITKVEATVVRQPGGGWRWWTSGTLRAGAFKRTGREPNRDAAMASATRYLVDDAERVAGRLPGSSNGTSREMSNETR